MNQEQRQGRRISSHPLVTPEKLAEIEQVRQAEEAFFESSAGQKFLRQSKAECDAIIHGGARPGAGRKPVENPKVTLSLSVSPEIKAYLQAIGNASETTEQTLRRSSAFRQWRKSQQLSNPSTAD